MLLIAHSCSFSVYVVCATLFVILFILFFFSFLFVDSLSFVSNIFVSLFILHFGSYFYAVSTIHPYNCIWAIHVFSVRYCWMLRHGHISTIIHAYIFTFINCISIPFNVYLYHYILNALDFVPNWSCVCLCASWCWYCWCVYAWRTPCELHVKSQ